MVKGKTKTSTGRKNALVEYKEFQIKDRIILDKKNAKKIHGSREETRLKCKCNSSKTV